MEQPVAPASWGVPKPPFPEAAPSDALWWEVGLWAEKRAVGPPPAASLSSCPSEFRRCRAPALGGLRAASGDLGVCCLRGTKALPPPAVTCLAAAGRECSLCVLGSPPPKPGVSHVSWEGPDRTQVSPGPPRPLPASARPRSRHRRFAKHARGCVRRQGHWH